ncbi:MAG: hypothetical protein IPJ98_05790 [Bryobacterales bacterium]|nr:hypothetical protein [Bryobacterales bacterium]
MKAWFQQDDFAWLGLGMHVQSGGDLLDALFAPKAQGTIRPWSERAFFMGFFALFGLDALPYRILVFSTQLLNLGLLIAITRRLTGSWLAAALAPLFWTANAALGLPLSWTSSYNQVLCAFFLLAAFYCLLRWVETGALRWYAAQCAVFLLGFGALELNVVYPALAAAYTFLASRRHFIWTLPLFAISGGYAVLHRSLAPSTRTGPYAMHFDSSILTTLLTYWNDAFGAARLPSLDVPPWLSALGLASPWILSLALALFLAFRLRARQWAVLWPPAWFLAVIGPVLPLRDHISDYYNAIPTLGLAVLGAWAFSSAWHAHSAGKAAALLGAALYLATSTPVARATVRYNFERSRAVRDLVLGVARARELHTNKVILLNGVGTDRFWAGMNDKPFRLLGINDVWLTPGSEDSIQAFPDLGDVNAFVYPPAATLRALAQNQAVVYEASGPRLRNITQTYGNMARLRLKPTLPSRIDAGNPAFADQLGEGWHEAEGGYRWMAKRAVVRLGVPAHPVSELFLQGFCPASQLSQGPLHLQVFIAGKPNPPVVVDRAGEEFRFPFPLPEPLKTKDPIEIVLEVDRTVTPPGDGRSLGLAFGSFALR